MKQITNMKIDKLIELLKPHTTEVIITIDKRTIDSFFDELNNNSWTYATWKNPDPNPIGTRAVYRNGVTIYFIELIDN